MPPNVQVGVACCATCLHEEVFSERSNFILELEFLRAVPSIIDKMWACTLRMTWPAEILPKKRGLRSMIAYIGEARQKESGDYKRFCLGGPSCWQYFLKCAHGNVGLENYKID